MDREFVKNLVWYYSYLIRNNITLKESGIVGGIDEYSPTIFEDGVSREDVLYHTLVRWAIVYCASESDFKCAEDIWYIAFDTPNAANCMGCILYHYDNPCYTTEYGKVEEICPIGQGSCDKLVRRYNIAGFLSDIWAKLIDPTVDYTDKGLDDYQFLIDTIKAEFSTKA